MTSMKQPKSEIKMSIKFSVPFFENTPDETHRVQACYKMLLKYFVPSKEYSWEELEKLTGKDPGMYTWPMTGLIWLTKNGYEAKYVEYFEVSYEQFIKGWSYPDNTVNNITVIKLKS